MSFISASLLQMAIGLFIGFGIGLTGVGAGVLIVPALIHFLGLAPVNAVGTGLAFAMVTKIQGAAYHFRMKNIRLRRSLFFLAGSIPGVLLSSRLINYFVSIYGLQKINQNLRLLIGIILALTAALMLLQLFTLDKENRLNHIEESQVLPVPEVKKMGAVLLGFIVGAFIGTTSIGGGVLIIPILLIFLDASAQQAVGTSIFISVVLCFLGGAVYFLHGHVNLLPTALLCLGAFPGVRWGSQFSGKLPEAVLIVVVTILVALSGISMFF